MRAFHEKIRPAVDRLASLARLTARAGSGDSDLVAPLGGDVALGDDHFLLPQMADLAIGTPPADDRAPPIGLVVWLAGNGPASIPQSPAASARSKSQSWRVGKGNLDNALWLPVVWDGRPARAPWLGYRRRLVRAVWNAVHTPLRAIPHLKLCLSSGGNRCPADHEPAVIVPQHRRILGPAMESGVSRRRTCRGLQAARASLGASPGDHGGLSVQWHFARSGDLGSSPSRLRVANALFYGPANCRDDECFAAKKAAGVGSRMAKPNDYNRDRRAALADPLPPSIFEECDRSVSPSNTFAGLK